MVERTTPHFSILQDLRARVLLSDPEDPIILHETELSQEFGISRTPIRRVMQAMAHEKLLKTHSGYGSIPTPLVLEKRRSDFLVYAQLARAAANVTSESVPSDVQMRMLGIAQLARFETDKTPEFFVQLSLESAQATSQVVQDPILSEALAMSRYRVIRWLVQDCRKVQAEFWERTVDNFDRAAQALTSGNAAGYLSTVADIVEGMATRAHAPGR